MSVWTAGYLICYGITWGYNAYFWDNSIAGHVYFGSFALLASGRVAFCLSFRWLRPLLRTDGRTALCGRRVWDFLCGRPVSGFTDYVPTRLGLSWSSLWEQQSRGNTRPRQPSRSGLRCSTRRPRRYCSRRKISEVKIKFQRYPCRCFPQEAVLRTKLLCRKACCKSAGYNF